MIMTIFAYIGIVVSACFTFLLIFFCYVSVLDYFERKAMHKKHSAFLGKGTKYEINDAIKNADENEKWG